MRLKMPVIIGLLLAATLAGCAHSRPPGSVVQAIHAVNRYAPEYVAEANNAFDQTKHPDAERLCGISERILGVLCELERLSLNE